MSNSKVPEYFQPPRYTYEDFKHWPGDWELIYGYAVSLLPWPERKHQGFASKINCWIGNSLEANACQCEVYPGLDWIIDNETTVRPDLMIVCGTFETDFLTVPPALIVEIASASTWVKDRNIKYKLYETQGVKYYLLADPEKRTWEAFELTDGVYQPKGGNHLYQITDECSLELDLSKLF
jgi:Uma2 family endonuclease